jgi:phage host-nuclease inhibitor protein Gam
MGTTRKKKVVVTGVTKEEAEQAFGVYAKADAEYKKITAGIELQCAKIREKWEKRLLELDGERDGAFDVLQSYATEHQQELFVKKKSVEMTHGVIGFRTGTPKLKTLKGFTWASALQLVKKFLPGYVRQTEEVAKDKLLADRELEEVPFGDAVKTQKSMKDAMDECGLQVVQDETFFVEPKSED